MKKKKTEEKKETVIRDLEIEQLDISDIGNYEILYTSVQDPEFKIVENFKDKIYIIQNNKAFGAFSNEYDLLLWLFETNLIMSKECFKFSNLITELNKDNESLEEKIKLKDDKIDELKNLMKQLLESKNERIEKLQRQINDLQKS